METEENNSEEQNPSSTSQKLAAGTLKIFEPPLLSSHEHLKELIGKQNKLYIELSTVKHQLNDGHLQTMMTNVQKYGDKLKKIKKHIQNIYDRTKNLKKRAKNLEASKYKQQQRTLQKQLQEELLICKSQEQHEDNPTSTTPKN